MDLKEKSKSLTKSKSKSLTKSKSKSLTKSKSKSLTKSKSKSLSKGKSKSLSKSVSKSVNKSVSKSSYSSINTFVSKIKREHGELDASYKMRLEFIQNCLNKKKVEKKALYIPYLSSMSFIHYYKSICGNKYPVEIEKEYTKLLE
jgi:hypothetical protein